ncbi:hypothetical protein GCM10023322_59380 [Rugosimonospora acidiphila]|uniref:Capsular polysaccharide biosynthesis protein n=1 Tax=Rugosimonospora acidiphila TaxID=556531 RepID=A0ABP9SFG9_9ACTN
MSRSFNVKATLRAARRRAVVPALGLIIGLAAAQLVTNYMPATYEASASMVITASGFDPTTKAKIPDLALAQNLAPTVAQLAQSREVALDTARALRLAPGAVVGHLTGTYQQGMQIITVKATAVDGGTAAAIANAATEAAGERFSVLQIGDGGNVTTKFIDRASPPQRPTSPNPQLNDALGAFAGLLAGLGLARLSGRVDDRMRRPARIGAELGLPLLGVLPRLPRRYARHNASVLYTRSSVADAVSATVAAISVLTSPLPRRRLLVTSVHDDDGKGLVSALLALSLAQDHDRVTLIEGQPRRPGIGGHFPEAAPCTLQGVLAGETAPRLLPGSSALSVIVAGPKQKRPEEEPVTGRQVGVLMDAVAQDEAVTIVHAPPVLAGAELATLARHADGVLLVVQTGVTRRADALRAAMLVRRLNVPVAGVVVVDLASDGIGEQYSEDGLATPVPAQLVPVPPQSVPPQFLPVPAQHTAAPAPVAAPSGGRRRASAGHRATNAEPAAPTDPSVAAQPTPVAPPAPTARPRRRAPAAPAPAPVAAPPAMALPPVAPMAPSAGGPMAVPPPAAWPTAVPPISVPPVGAGTGDWDDPARAAKHRRRDRVDALSAPFEALLSETVEFTSPAGPAPAAASGDDQSYAGGWTAADQPWQYTANRSVPDARRSEPYQPKEFA